MKEIISVRKYFCDIEMLWKWEVVVISDEPLKYKLGECEILQNKDVTKNEHIKNNMSEGGQP